MNVYIAQQSTLSSILSDSGQWLICQKQEGNKHYALSFQKSMSWGLSKPLFMFEFNNMW